MAKAGIEHFRAVEAKEVGNKDVEKKLAAAANASNEYVKYVKDEKEIALMKHEDELQRKALEMQIADVMESASSKFGIEGKFSSFDDFMHSSQTRELVTTLEKELIKVGRNDLGALDKFKKDKKILAEDKVWLVEMYEKNIGNKDLNKNQKHLLEAGIEKVNASIA